MDKEKKNVGSPDVSVDQITLQETDAGSPSDPPSGDFNLAQNLPAQMPSGVSSPSHQGGATGSSSPRRSVHSDSSSGSDNEPRVLDCSISLLTTDEENSLLDLPIPAVEGAIATVGIVPKDFDGPTDSAFVRTFPSSHLHESRVVDSTQVGPSDLGDANGNRNPSRDAELRREASIIEEMAVERMAARIRSGLPRRCKVCNRLWGLCEHDHNPPDFY